VLMVLTVLTVSSESRLKLVETTVSAIEAV
jgi:hypothetical protein